MVRRLKVFAIVGVIMAIVLAIVLVGTNTVAVNLDVGTLDSTMTVQYMDGSTEVLTRTDVFRTLAAVTFGGKAVQSLAYDGIFTPTKPDTPHSMKMEAVLVCVQSSSCAKGDVVKREVRNSVDSRWFQGATFVDEFVGDYSFAFVAYVESRDSLGLVRNYAVSFEIPVNIQRTVIEPLVVDTVIDPAVAEPVCGQATISSGCVVVAEVTPVVVGVIKTDGPVLWPGGQPVIGIR